MIVFVPSPKPWLFVHWDDYVLATSVYFYINKYSHFFLSIKLSFSNITLPKIVIYATLRPLIFSNVQMEFFIQLDVQSFKALHFFCSPTYNNILTIFLPVFLIEFNIRFLLRLPNLPYNICPEITYSFNKISDVILYGPWWLLNIQLILYQIMLREKLLTMQI